MTKNLRPWDTHDLEQALNAVEARIGSDGLIGTKPDWRVLDQLGFWVAEASEQPVTIRTQMGHWTFRPLADDEH